MATSSIDPNSVQRELNNSIIALFLHSYDIKESKRKDAVTTKEQGALTIEKADGPLTAQQENIINLLKFYQNMKWDEIVKLFNRSIGNQQENRIKEQIEHIQGILLGMENYILPPVIDIEHMIETIYYFWNNYLALFGGSRIEEGFIRFTLKRFYCYCTGGKIVHDIRDREGNINYIRLTGSHGPRAEVEHIIGWRMMLTVGGDLATSTTFSDQVELAVHSKVYEDGEVDRYQRNCPSSPWTADQVAGKELPPAKMKTETSFGRDSLWTIEDWLNEEGVFVPNARYEAIVANLHKIISKFGGLPSFHSATLNHAENRGLFLNMFKQNADLGEAFLLNIEQIIHNGYWYSNRLFNQIKGSMSIFSLTRQTFMDNGEESLFFRVSHTRLNFLCDIFLAYIYNADENGTRKLISDYDEYLLYKNNWDGGEYSFDIITNYLKVHAEDDLKSQRQEVDWSTVSGRQYNLMHYYLNGIYKINNDITKQEWEWLHDICIRFENIDSVKRHLIKNLIYIGDQLVTSLNENMEMRIYFQSKRKGPGLKFSTSGATSGLNSDHGTRVSNSFDTPPRKRKRPMVTMGSINARAVPSPDRYQALPAVAARETFIHYFEIKYRIQGGSGKKTRKKKTRRKKKRTRRKK